MSKVLAAQAAENQEHKAAHDAEYAALVDAQANEVHELTETVTGMIALGSAWAPHEKSTKAWVVQLRKNRFRPCATPHQFSLHTKALGSRGFVRSRCR